MPHRTETAWYPEENLRVSVLSRGAHVSLISWNAYGLYHEVYEENVNLIFDEEEEIDEVQ